MAVSPAAPPAARRFPRLRGNGRPVRVALAIGLFVATAWVRSSMLSADDGGRAAQQIVRMQLAQRLPATAPGAAPEESEARRRCDVDRAIGEDPAAFAREVAEKAARLRADFSHTTAEGREYRYLDDTDSYLWLRRAQRYLASGTTCDEIAGGVCRDDHMLAPLGRAMPYARSLHIAAIVATHRIASFFDPGRPLWASSALVPLIAGALCVLPAFAIGCRLAGSFGAAAAAVLIALNPFFVLRSAGSDNDVWNVLLPLLAAWAAVEALASASVGAASARAVLAAAFVALHAATWSGWIFSFLVLLSSLLFNVFLQGLRFAARRGTRREALRTLSVAAVFYASAALATAATGAGGQALVAPWRQLTQLIATAPGAESPSSALVAPWPDNFATVAESHPLRARGTITDHLQGPLFLFVAWIGLLVLALPARVWRARHFVVLIGGAVLYRGLFTSDAPAATVLLLLAVPLGAASVIQIIDRDPPRDGGAAWILVAWFLAALYQAHAGLRFDVLLIPAFGLSAAVAAGRFHQYLDRGCARLGAGTKTPARLTTLALLSLPLLAYAREARTEAGATAPMINGAWWAALQHIRDATPADAIVDTWWDYGHWVTYVADRRVNADGASLLTRVPQWTAGALLAPSEAEAAGLLRMLNCGSDAAGQPEERRGAYGRLSLAGIGDVAAQELVTRIASVGRADADGILRRRGLGERERAEVLAATHCRPPPAFLVLSSRMVWMHGWWRLANWNAEATRVLRWSAEMREEEAVGLIGERFGYGEPVARDLYRKAAALRTAAQAEAFASPPPGYLAPGWLPCSERGSAIACAVGARIDPPGSELRELVYRPEEPAASFFRIVSAGGEEVAEAPAALVLARAGGLETVSPSAPVRGAWAVVYDELDRRVLIGSPDLVRSTFTQLVFLDGRYNRRFRKFDERRSATGERVITWEVLSLP